MVASKSVAVKEEESQPVHWAFQPAMMPGYGVVRYDTMTQNRQDWIEVRIEASVDSGELLAPESCEGTGA
ncbi:MAG: hypothetical protein FJ249_07025 [Nitrospira sp.]|nr:hypothetical protein [Nitrospira sp.]